MQYMTNLRSGINIDGIDTPREESVQRVLDLVVDTICEDRYKPAIHYICIDSYNGSDANLNQDRYYAHIHQSMLEYEETKWKEHPYNCDGLEFLGTDYFILIKHLDQCKVATYEVHKLSNEVVGMIKLIESGLRDNYLAVLKGLINGPLNQHVSDTKEVEEDA